MTTNALTVTPINTGSDVLDEAAGLLADIADTLHKIGHHDTHTLTDDGYELFEAVEDALSKVDAARSESPADAAAMFLALDRVETIQRRIRDAGADIACTRAALGVA